MIVIIDNYDSFVHNVARYFKQLGTEVVVLRNDAVTVAEVAAYEATHLVLSPGPGAPNDAGISMALIERYAGIVPILGICLGHQAIGQVFGGVVGSARLPMHGKSSLVEHSQTGIFKGIPNPCLVGRYHSLIVDFETLPACLTVTARSKEGEIMALKHKTYPVYGLQFHPESILTEHGYRMLENFIALTEG